ncbi:tetratricopeptide repeat-containing diguanylate cyclase [Marinicella marina]|uniref:tetratricopeptide repeat-containing diguanylate cyclase n=2 Tax=Marinicella marina TaxID=2996016 RepID=UPI0024BD1390|nr:diguanylate cyclase [Marinicella marina]MDJ1139868.1 diguanylate cyclase [Marinicella marina]
MLVFVLMGSTNMAFGSDQGSVSFEREQCTALEDDKPADAIALAQQQLESLDQRIKPIDYAHFLGCMGWAYAATDSIQAAKKTAFDLFTLISQQPKSTESIKLTRRAGAIYHRIGERISAVEIYQEAMNQATALDIVPEQIPLLINLGVLNSEIENHETAIDNYYTALDLMEANDDFRYQPPVLFNLANTLRGQNRHSEALKIYSMTEALITEQWPKSRAAQIYFGIGASYQEVENYEKAIEYVDKAIELIEPETDESVFNYVIQITEANLDLSVNPDANYIDLADQAYAFFNQAENSKALLGVNHPLGSLAMLYERLNQPEKALAVYKKHRTLLNEFQKTFNKDYMAQMQNQLSDSQKREQLALQNSAQIKNQLAIEASENQRLITILVVSFIMLLLVLFVLWQYITNRKLKQMAMTDTLTQLGNRRALQGWHIEHKLPAPPAKRYLWLIDLDNFKTVNDDYDHDVGDTALIKIAACLEQFLTPERYVCRWGGEEFLLLTDDIPPEKINQYAQLLLNAIANVEISTGMNTFSLTASIGISEIIDLQRPTWRRALYSADKALYTAKDRGRNCVVMATSQS